MRSIRHIALAVAAAGTLAALPAAAGEDLNPDAFVKMCDGNGDGMVSKAEVMKHVEKMFDKHDKKRAGKLDKKQVEFFLQELMQQGA